jgi:hypothetical protein
VLLPRRLSRASSGPGVSAAMWPKADGAHEVVDLPVALPVDHPSGLPLCRATGCTRETTSLVTVLDCLDVPEVAG